MKTTSVWLLALLLVFVCLAASYRLMCSCGHMQPTTLPVLAICGLLLWPWTLRGSFVPRALVASVPLLLLAANLVDVLWHGHTPLWAGVPRPAFLLIDQEVALRLTVLGVPLGTALALRWALARAAARAAEEQVPA